MKIDVEQNLSNVIFLEYMVTRNNLCWDGVVSCYTGTGLIFPLSKFAYDLQTFLEFSYF